AVCTELERGDARTGQRCGGNAGAARPELDRRLGEWTRYAGRTRNGARQLLTGCERVENGKRKGCEFHIEGHRAIAERNAAADGPANAFGAGYGGVYGQPVTAGVAGRLHGKRTHAGLPQHRSGNRVPPQVEANVRALSRPGDRG